MGNSQWREFKAANAQFEVKLQEAFAIKRARRDAIESDAPLEEVGDFLWALDRYSDEREYFEKDKWLQANFKIAADNIFFYGFDEDCKDEYAAWKPYFDRIRNQIGDGATWNEIAAFSGATRTIGTYDEWRFTNEDGHHVDVQISVGDPRAFYKWRIQKF